MSKEKTKVLCNFCTGEVFRLLYFTLLINEEKEFGKNI